MTLWPWISANFLVQKGVTILLPKQSGPDLQHIYCWKNWHLVINCSNNYISPLFENMYCRFRISKRIGNGLRKKLRGTSVGSCILKQVKAFWKPFGGTVCLLCIYCFLLQVFASIFFLGKISSLYLTNWPSPTFPKTSTINTFSVVLICGHQHLD